MLYFLFLNLLCLFRMPFQLRFHLFYLQKKNSRVIFNSDIYTVRHMYALACISNIRSQPVGVGSSGAWIHEVRLCRKRIYPLNHFACPLKRQFKVSLLTKWNKQNTGLERDGTAVKSTSCELEFNSQSLFNGSQSSLTPVPEDPIPSCGLLGHQAPT